jgi:alpha-1,3-mannosyltransferase
MIGGLENYVLNLAKEQVNSGLKVSVVTLNKSFIDNHELIPNETIYNIDIIRIPYFGSPRYPLAFTILKYLKGFDIVHVHAVDFFADFLSLTKLFHRKPLILTTHGGFFHTKKNLMLKKMVFHIISRITLTNYKTIIACSYNDLQTFSKISKNVIHIGNGVDINKYIRVPKKIKKGTIVTIGRIDSHKGIDKLLIIMHKLKERGINSKLEIIGPDNRNLVPSLQLQAKQLNIENEVVFRGEIEEDELIESYSQAHLFISASAYEGFGIAAVEALSSGTLCILNNISAFGEIIENKEFGKIVNFNNVDEVIDGIIKFLNLSESTYKDLSDKARLFAEGYNWKQTASKIYNVYTSN